ncbi:iron complex outermembrane receptor protein [Pseudoduganella flava]|uniref:Iron complex outermembrane receptor protein n=1 Tax=Pseudoduganella flava TaxID=871742 RepID=A0A562PVJ9_9BURK|nr:TonB-dependent receptor [Pseudoduganella flava]QGZ39574.1 TonB-dependent receptor [Pseudoduganella flava]TWI48471.1 iron complex outermembrane receptor protein [Pseudoduganella flava]
MTFKRRKIAGATLCALTCLATERGAAAAESPNSADVDSGQSVIVTGTRASNRTQFDTLAPVDVFSREEIAAVESSDLNDVLAQLVPSYVVQRLPMADGQVFVRPATLRGLSPDQTLVLVNGRRFHRSALLGARGAQAADLAQIPTSAIKRIEVLRDGASAQYGSDAIAGVINIILDDAVGAEISAHHSQYSEADGKTNELRAKYGLAFGTDGKLNLFAEAMQSDPTSRTRQRADAIAFQAAHPQLTVPNPVQRWGQPELDSQHLGYNASVGLGGDTVAYSYALFTHSKGTSDFNWRNPDTSTSVFKTTTVFPGWDVRSIYPVGFSPQYTNKSNDAHVLAGVRGNLSDALAWDVSASYGRNAIDYGLHNSINASLGPNSPTSFYLGRLTQDEKLVNANFNYAWNVPALAQPVNVGFGAEYRNERYAVRAGDPASYAVGPGAAMGLDANANGAPGFSNTQAGRWDQNSYAAYADVEAPLTSRFTVGAALRYEDYSEFGDTWNGKLSARFALSPDVGLRASYSTGFRAPTPGQLNTNSTSQGLDTRTLLVFSSGRLSNSDPLAVMLGAQPLQPEKSKNLSLGLTWKSALGLSGSVDLYDIKVRDRFSTSASFAVPAGVANPLRYTSVNYFTNDFDTSTRGIDVVGSWRGRVADGTMNLTAAYNYNKTEVDGGSSAVATNTTQRLIFEERLPRQKATFSAAYDRRVWSALARLRYYGSWTDSTGNATGDIFQRFGAMRFLDLAASWRVTPTQTLRFGVDNVLDKYPDEAVFQASRGLIYSRNAPYDTDGRNLYVDYTVKF